MIKCDYCKKKIDTPWNTIQLDIVWWFEGNGIDDKRVVLGEFHEDCAEKFIKMLKQKIKNKEVNKSGNKS